MQAATLFTPSAFISRRTVQLLITGQVIFLLLVWMFSPFTFLPRPHEVWSSLHDLWFFDNLGIELFTSFTLNLETILFSTIISLALAYLNTLPFFRPVVALFGRLRFLSMVGLSFFFTLMTRNGHQLKLSMLVFSVSVFFVTGMADVIAGIPKEQYDLARTLHMGPWRTMWEVVVLGQIDRAFEVLRQNAAIGFLMLTLVEGMSRSGGGIGSLLLNQNRYFHLSAVMAIQLCVLAIGLAQDYAIGAMRRIVCPYADLRRSR